MEEKHPSDGACQSLRFNTQSAPPSRGTHHRCRKLTAPFASFMESRRRFLSLLHDRSGAGLFFCRRVSFQGHRGDLGEKGNSRGAWPSPVPSASCRQSRLSGPERANTLLPASGTATAESVGCLQSLGPGVLLRKTAASPEIRGSLGTGTNMKGLARGGGFPTRDDGGPGGPRE